MILYYEWAYVTCVNKGFKKIESYITCEIIKGLQKGERHVKMICKIIVILILYLRGDKNWILLI